MPWKLPEDDGELLALAKSYPFDAPPGSYLFTEGSARPLARAGYEGRVPVVAHGSNRAPAQLHRKFGLDAEIPVTVGWLTDYDVVYSAHITQYGAVASTLQHTPGTRARVSLTWLSERQLRRMHETEGPSTYAFGRLAGIELRLVEGPAERVGEAYVYLGRNGCLDLDGGPVGLAAVSAEGRAHQSRSQEAALTLVRDRHRPGLAIDRLILEAVRRPERRHALVAEMRARALPAFAPHFEEVSGEDPLARTGS